MPDSAVRSLLAAATGAFHTCALLGYDPIRPHDAFGEIMVRNLDSMGAPFVGIHDCPDEAAHSARALECGFQGAAAVDLASAWARGLDAAELQRLQRLEPLDEVEEWQLMMRHYALVWAVKGASLCGAVASAGAGPLLAALVTPRTCTSCPEADALVDSDSHLAAPQAPMEHGGETHSAPDVSSLKVPLPAVERLFKADKE